MIKIKHTLEHSSDPSRVVELGWRKFFLSVEFDGFMTCVILFNAVTMGLQTYPKAIEYLSATFQTNVAWWIERVDWFVILLFCVEVGGRACALKRNYLKDRWNAFDAIIVFLTLVSQSQMLASLRVLRVLRILRLLTRFRSLRIISGVIVQSLSGCFAISILMVVTLYIFAVIGHDLFGVNHPDLFGNLHIAMYTLFRVAALGKLDEVVFALSTNDMIVYLFLVPYFIVMSYVVINFFSAIVVYYIYELSFEEMRNGKSVDKPQRGPTEVENMKTHTPLETSTEKYEELLLEIRKLRQEVCTIKKSNATATNITPQDNIN